MRPRALAAIARHARIKQLVIPKVIASTALHHPRAFRAAHQVAMDQAAMVEISVPILIVLHATNLAALRNQVASGTPSTIIVASQSNKQVTNAQIQTVPPAVDSKSVTT